MLEKLLAAWGLWIEDFDRKLFGPTIRRHWLVLRWLASLPLLLYAIPGSLIAPVYTISTLSPLFIESDPFRSDNLTAGVFITALCWVSTWFVGRWVWRNRGEPKGWFAEIRGGVAEVDAAPKSGGTSAITWANVDWTGYYALGVRIAALGSVLFVMRSTWMEDTRDVFAVWAVVGLCIGPAIALVTSFLSRGISGDLAQTFVALRIAATILILVSGAAVIAQSLVPLAAASYPKLTPAGVGQHLGTYWGGLIGTGILLSSVWKCRMLPLAAKPEDQAPEGGK